TDADDASVTLLEPGLAISKSVYAGHDGGASCRGDEVVTAPDGHRVTWCFAATNTGEVPLDVSITDPQLMVDDADMTLLSGTTDGLAPGATVELYFESLVEHDMVNVATGSGRTPTGAVVTDADDAAVEEVGPAVRIDKTVYAGHDGGQSCTGTDLLEGERGSPVTYCFVITNDGDAELAPVSIVDPALGITTADMEVVSGDPARVPIGGSVVVFHETTLNGDLMNTATVTAT
ncbi:MAG: hypothetical protein AAGK32_22280, partial [Actinomycetota bacterium]